MLLGLVFAAIVIFVICAFLVYFLYKLLPNFFYQRFTSFNSVYLAAGLVISILSTLAIVLLTILAYRIVPGGIGDGARSWTGVKWFPLYGFVGIIGTMILVWFPSKVVAKNGQLPFWYGLVLALISTSIIYLQYLTHYSSRSLPMPGYVHLIMIAAIYLVFSPFIFAMSKILSKFRFPI